MNKDLIADILTLRMIGDYRVKDNADSMRIRILAMDLSEDKYTVETLKKESIGFRTCSSNFNFSDEYLQELINQVKELSHE